jgi:hypothetical protein
VYLLQLGPKVNVLGKMVYSEVFIQIDFLNPTFASTVLFTFQDFLFEHAKIRGAISFVFLPSSQGASQNEVLHPLPMVILVAA